MSVLRATLRNSVVVNKRWVVSYSVADEISVKVLVPVLLCH